MKLIAIILLTVFSACCFSQDFPRDYGVISQAEHELKFFPKDPAASALILYDRGESLFFEKDNGYYIRFTRQKRIKIFTKAGMEYAEIVIPFYYEGFVKSEKVVSIRAVTYNYEDNKVNARALDVSGVYEDIVNERWRVKKFTFPNVKEGSVLEYEYVLETPFHFNLPDWKFQDRIPTLHSEYIVKTIPFYDYCFIAQNISKFDYQNSSISPEVRTYGSVNMVHGKNFGTGFQFRDVIHRFVKKDVPAFYDEAYISSTEDYIMKLDFQLERFNKPSGGSEEIITTWPKLITFMIKYEKFGKYILSARKLAKKNLKSMAGLDGLSEEEKIMNIIQYVRSSVSWNGRHDKYASKSPKELIVQKSGSSADINLFLLAHLQEAGIDALPVIISTRDHGKIKMDYPFDHFFNNVLVLVNLDGKNFLTDGTDDMIAYNRIPLRCINDKGLIINNKDEVSWVNLTGNIISLDKKEIKLTLNPEIHSLNASVSIQSTEYEAYKYKNLFRDDTTKIRANLQMAGFTNVDGIQTYNYHNNKLPYVINSNGELPLDMVNEKIIISPFLIFPEKENKLKQPSRTYPVDFIYAKKEEYKSVIGVPEGYKVTGLPDKYEVDNTLVEIKVSYAQTENLIEADAFYVLKNPVYYSNDYERLKHYMDLIITKLNEQIVLTRE